MEDVIDVLLDVARTLDSASIPYMVSGSMAANIYAEPRFTNDVDFVIQVLGKQQEALLQLFGERYYITREAVADAFAGRGMFNIIHNAQSVKCDLILLKGDSFSQSAFARRRQQTLRGYSVNFMSMEDLILQKLLWRKETGSEVQLGDVRRMIALNKAGIDSSYCFQWARELGVEDDVRAVL